MATTPEQLATILADELMDDLRLLATSIVQFNERWSKYGDQYAHLLPPAKQTQVEQAFQHYYDTLQPLVDDN